MATRIPINKEVNNFDDRQKRIWVDMEQDMERRRREWEGEIEKMRSDFFQLRPEKGAANLEGAPQTLTSRMSAPVRVLESDDGKPLVEKDEFGNPVFKVRFNMKEYRPEEVNVKMDSNKIMVSAKHEEKGQGSSVSREYNREVNIPAEVDPLSLQCVFQPDGYLVFTAPLPAPKYNAIKDSHAATSHNAPNVTKASSSFQSSSSSKHPGNGSHMTTVPVTSLHRESPYHHQPVQMQHHVQSHSQPINQQHNVTSTFSKAASSPYSSTSTLNRAETNEHPDHVVPSFKPPPDMRKLDQLLEKPAPPLSSHLLHTASPTQILNSSPLHKAPPFSTLSSTFPTGPMFSESSPQAQLSNPVVTSHDGKFQLTMPIDDFKPEELTVKTQDRKVIICAKRQVSNGNRNHTMEMNREHSLPDNVDPLTVKAFFTDTDKLIVEAPYIY